MTFIGFIGLIGSTDDYDIKLLQGIESWLVYLKRLIAVYLVSLWEDGSWWKSKTPEFWKTCKNWGLMVRSLYISLTCPSPSYHTHSSFVISLRNCHTSSRWRSPKKSNSPTKRTRFGGRSSTSRPELPRYCISIYSSSSSFDYFWWALGFAKSFRPHRAHASIGSRVHRYYMVNLSSILITESSLTFPPPLSLKECWR